MYGSRIKFHYADNDVQIKQRGKIGKHVKNKGTTVNR